MKSIKRDEDGFWALWKKFDLKVTPGNLQVISKHINVFTECPTLQVDTQTFLFESVDTFYLKMAVTIKLKFFFNFDTREV